MGLLDRLLGGGNEDAEEDMDDDAEEEEAEGGDDDEAEDISGNNKSDLGDDGKSNEKDDDNADDMDNKKDPAQDGEGSLQDGPNGEKDPAQDGPGSKQDGPDKDKKKEEEKKKNEQQQKSAKGAAGGKAGPPGKKKDPWDPEVTMEIAKQTGIPPIPIPRPCPECKKMSLYLDTWVKNGGRLTILMAYTLIMLIVTKSCPVHMKDIVQQVHFVCLNAKCKKFYFNAYGFKFVPGMEKGAKLEPRQWLFKSPFPKMTTKQAEKVRDKVSNKSKGKK